MKPLQNLAIAALMMLASACGPQTFVEINTASEGSFTVADPAPTVRPYQDGVMVVLTEEQEEQLAVVTIELPDVDSLEQGEVVNIDDTGITITASRGDLEVINRADGSRVVNSRDARSFTATAGTFTLDSREPLAGTFEVELEDGGMLVGAFVTR